jgi:hypothetical protein
MFSLPSQENATVKSGYRQRSFIEQIKLSKSNLRKKYQRKTSHENDFPEQEGGELSEKTTQNYT